MFVMDLLTFQVNVLHVQTMNVKTENAKSVEETVRTCGIVQEAAQMLLL
jgi:hypothetical protein